MKPWLHDNGIEIYSTEIKLKSVVAQRFIKTLETKICKYISAVSMKVCIVRLEEIHRTFKMKTADVQLGTYTEYGVGNNNKDPKLNVGDHVRISKCKNIFADGNTQNCSGEVIVIKRVKK